ncbi:MAG: protein kinase [Myxococcota bacterium]
MATEPRSAGPRAESLGTAVRRLAIGATGQGRQNGTYRLIAPVARGGMGEVFLAEHTAANGQRRQVIIKRLLENLREDTSHIAMFKTEAEHLGALDHPNIVKILDVPDINGARCLALEYVKGRSVAQILDRARHVGQRLPPTLVIHIACEVLEGLEHVHGARLPDGKPLMLVHRDVTPGNLLVSFDGEVKITDFGISKSLMSAVSTTVGIVKGKARYLAPEQILGEKASPRSDLFSTACVIYEMLTSVPLFDRVSVPKTLTAIVHGEVPDLRLTLPVPTRTADLIGRTLAIEPDKRHASAKELARDLRAAAQEMGPTGKQELASFVRTLFEGLDESWEQLPLTADEKRDVEEEEAALAAEQAQAADRPLFSAPAPRPSDAPPASPADKKASFRAASIAEEEAVSRTAKPRAEETLLVERVQNKKAEAAARVDSTDGEEATQAIPEPPQKPSSVHLSDPDHPPMSAADPHADIATVAEIPLRPAAPLPRTPSDFEDRTEHLSEPPAVRRSKPLADVPPFETEQIHTDEKRPRALAYAARVESRPAPEPERPIRPTEPTIVKREAPRRPPTEGAALQRWMAQVPGAVLIGVFALGALAGVAITAVFRYSEPEPKPAVTAAPSSPAPPHEAEILEPIAEEPEGTAEPEAEPEPEAAAEAAPVEGAATVDLLFPKTARIKIDGETLTKKAPIHGQTLAPGRHEIVVTLKKWRRQVTLEVAPGSHHRLDLDEMKRSGVP